MPAISIYVPDEMKARMDKAEKSANWSAIAQRAFDVELNHLERIKEIKTMSDVIERLRASKDQATADALYEGRENGLDWAKRHAEYDELRRIVRLDISEWPDDDQNAYNVAQSVYMNVMEEESRPSNDELASLYGVEEEDVDRISKAFVEGFIEGAQDVWDEVKDQL